jgi:hypothetical protein
VGDGSQRVAEVADVAIAAVDFEVERLYELAEGCTVDGVTAGGIAYGLWQAPDGAVRITWDGHDGAPITDLVKTRDDRTQFWSDDGRHMAMLVGRDTAMYVFRDGEYEGPWTAVSGSARPVFSADGRLAYGAERDGVSRLIVDRVGVGDGDLAPIQPVFSADGTRLAFAEIRTVDKHPEFRIVVDGEPGPWFAGMRNAAGALQFSPDGQRFASYSVDGEGHGRWTVDGVAHRFVNDNRPIGFAQMRGIGVLDPPLPAAFSPDSSRFAYEADVLEKGVAVVENDLPGPLLKAAGKPVFSPDSRHLAYLGQAFDKRMGLVLDGALGPTYPAGNGGLPVFSPDSQHTALSIRIEEGGFLRKKRLEGMLIDGEPIVALEARDSSYQPAWSPDCSELAWWLETPDGRIGVYRHAQEIDRLAQIAAQPFYTRTGTLVYAGQRPDGWSVMVDGRPGPVADGMVPVEAVSRPGPTLVTVRVTPDGGHVAWAGQFGDQQRPVLDDRVGPALDRIVGCEVADDGLVRWWGQRGTEVVVVVGAT